MFNDYTMTLAFSRLIEVDGWLTPGTFSRIPRASLNVMIFLVSLSSQRAFSWGLRTGKSCCGLDPEKKVDTQAVQASIIEFCYRFHFRP